MAFERDGASVALQAGDLQVVVDRSDLEPMTVAEVSAQAQGGAPVSVAGGTSARKKADSARARPIDAIVHDRRA